MSGTLQLDFTNKSGSLNLSTDIPQQTLLLKTARIEFNSDVNAFNSKYLLLDIPWISNSQSITNDSKQKGIMIPVSGNNLTILNNIDLAYKLQGPIPSHFKYQINGNSTIGFCRLTLIFQMDYGSLV